MSGASDLDQSRFSLDRWLSVCLVLLLGAVLVALLLGMRWGRGIGWDEAEFFRATDWVRQGKFPYRDFWEHHLPLQWFVMAPVAALVKGGQGIGPFVWMRFSQLPLWVLGTWIAWRFSRRAGCPAWVVGAGLGLMWSSLSFAPYALEYRQDVLSTCLYLAAVYALESNATSRRWGLAAGVLLGCSVAANLRMAPPALLTLGLYALGGPGSRWRGFSRAGLRSLAGFVLAIAFGAVLLASTRSWEPFWTETVVQNRLANSAPMMRIPIWHYLLQPFLDQDLPTVALLFGFALGLGSALMRLREWGLSQRLALLVVFQFVTLAVVKATYTYHLQLIFVLGTVLMTGEAGRWLALQGQSASQRLKGWACGGLAYALLNLVVFYDWRAQKALLAYQDQVLRALPERASPAEEVLDGCGYAYRNKPPFKYWFLPVHVRVLSMQGQWPAYTAAMMRADPPAAVLLTGRISAYFLAFPDLGIYFMHHYLPVYRNLWVPGFAGRLVPNQAKQTWTVSKGGTYRLVASRDLVQHPWFRIDPRLFGFGGAFPGRIPSISVNALGRSEPGVTWSLNGTVLPPGAGTVRLRPGDRLEAAYDGQGLMAVLAVPDTETVLFRDSPPAPCLDPSLDAIQAPLLSGFFDRL